MIRPAYIAALRAAYDTLLAHMAADGGVPMTDELARAIEVVEAHDAEGGRHDAEAFRNDAAVRVKLGPAVAEWLDGDPAT